ncbi:MAG: polyphosphate polymerase domain-containing protein [Oscillospiraceae bacterium]|jgi:hypothetical protein|nr:polyphosphate polymerase domain-containing protein [Oscillospiraceae bacterium]
MATEVFRRHEKKYRVPAAAFEALQDKLSDFMELDRYNEGRFTYPICNLYYDTADSALIRKSLQKPAYKEKLRLRSYGSPPDLNSIVYAEIKKKVAGVVGKRRCAMPLGTAYAYLESGQEPPLTPEMNPQILHEITWMLRQGLQPAVVIAYDRRAFFCPTRPDLRISFDTNIRSRRYDLRLEDGDYGDLLLPADTWLMEIKTVGSFPLHLSHLLAEYEIYPASFSKYGTEYKQFLAGNPAPFPEWEVLPEAASVE